MKNHSAKKIYECRAMKEDGGSYLSLIRPIAALSRALGTLGSRNAVIEPPSGEKKTRRTELQLLDGSRFSVFLFSIIGLKTNIHYTLHYLSSSYSWSQVPGIYIFKQLQLGQLSVNPPRLVLEVGGTST